MNETLVAAMMLAQFVLLMLTIWAERRAKEYAVDAAYEARSSARDSGAAAECRRDAFRSRVEAGLNAAHVARMTAERSGRRWAGEPNRADPESPVGHA